jgi:MinD-like ATPase involved in chromosome partitioning or flagellar assembly
VDGTETGWGRPAEPAPRWRALLDRALLGARTGEQPTVGDGGAAEAAAAARPADPRPGEPPAAEPRSRAASINPLPTRPVNPLERRHRSSLDQRPHPLEQRAAEPLPQRLDPQRLEPQRLDPQRPDPQRPELQRPELQRPELQRPELQRPEAQRPESRPANPLQRPVNPLDRRGGSRDPRGDAAERRPAEQRSLEQRPFEQRPVNPLEPRRHARPGEGFHGRADADAPHSYFNPTTRSVPAPITRVTQDNGYPPARAAASVGSAAVLPPPAPVAPPVPPPTAPPAALPAPAEPAVPATRAPASRATPTPTSPAPARIEWRQARPEQDLERAVAVLRRKIGRPRVLAFANPKGGVHKTTATVLAAATIGSVRGRGVLAWDDNELRGTLGLRAGSARHARTIRHLVSDLMQIENLHGDDLIHRLDDYLRHASDGSYDVLAGEENPRFAQRLDQHTVGRVTDLLRRTHDVICVDTGNNVESVNWQTVMKTADQLVITTVPREDAAFTADWMLDLLDDSGMEDLVSNAVTLISCPSAGRLPLLDDFSKHFATRTRAVAVVPYDPALEVGSSIEYSLLQPETRQAWLRAAAVMIEPFTE